MKPSMPKQICFGFKIIQVKAKPFFLANYIFTPCLFSIHCSCILHTFNIAEMVMLSAFFSLMYDVDVTHSVFLWQNLSSKDLLYITQITALKTSQGPRTVASFNYILDLSISNVYPPNLAFQRCVTLCFQLQ